MAESVKDLCSLGPSALGGGLGTMGDRRNDIAESKKKMINCPAANAQFQYYDYLKPEKVEGTTANYTPSCDIMQTRFHKGFQRRMKPLIQPDLPRLILEDKRFENQVTMTKRAFASRAPPDAYNIVTGAGDGTCDQVQQKREPRCMSKRIVNPTQSMIGVYAGHDLDMRNRQMQSKHRFYTHPWKEAGTTRSEQMRNEGFLECKKETMIIGVGSGQPRCRMQSQGVSDNFAHLRARLQEPAYERMDKTKSQIVFG